MDKAKLSRGLDIFAATLNYILISFALSNMLLTYRNNFIYVAFFASKVFVISEYLRRMVKLTGRRMFAFLLLLGCLIVQIMLFYALRVF